MSDDLDARFGIKASLPIWMSFRRYTLALVRKSKGEQILQIINE